MSFGQQGVLVRRLAAGAVDLAIEFGGGVLGSYFGVMVAALLTVLRNEAAESIQDSIWNGLGFGFVFWGISVSFINRVLIQGVSRASIGKKIFKLELISVDESITWTTILKRWVMSYVSFCIAGIGYVYSLFEEDGRTLHDLIAHTDVVPAYQGSSVKVEYRETSSVASYGLSMQELSKVIVLSSSSAERPTATVIRLPLRTEPMPMYSIQPEDAIQAERATLADVIEFVPASEKDSKKKTA